MPTKGALDAKKVLLAKMRTRLFVHTEKVNNPDAQRFKSFEQKSLNNEIESRWVK